MEKKGQNTHQFFDCIAAFFVTQSSVPWLTYIEQLAFFVAYPDRSATQICPCMSDTLPNDFVLGDSLAQRVFGVSSIVVKQTMAEICQC